MKNIGISLLTLPLLLWSHGGVDHSKSTQKQPSTAPTKQTQYTKINQAYIKNVKPVLRKKCFACHAEKPKNMPGYYSIPGAKQLMDYDMNEAKKHIDFRKNFHFHHMVHPKRILSVSKNLSKITACRRFSTNLFTGMPLWT